MKTITYTRRSLACQYFPDAEPEQAVRRNLTVREARLILEYLGEP